MAEDVSVKKARRITTLEIASSIQLPYINSNNLPQTPSIRAGAGGGLAFDVVTKRTWECIDVSPVRWRPIGGGGGGGGAILDYSIKKIGTQNIPPNVSTQLINFNGAGLNFDSTGPSWNLVNGEYVATTLQAFFINAEISWEGGNLGSRYLDIIYKPVGAPQIAKRSKTQANADGNEPTPVGATISLILNPGDRVWVEVRQTSPSNLNIDDTTTITGYRNDL
jgi:hypothetical protein